MRVVFIILGAVLVLVSSVGAAYGLQAPIIERDIVYHQYPGKSLTLDLYYPQSQDSVLPLIVNIHGGGWFSGDKTTGAGQADIPELTARGYIVASIDYRLAPRYPFPAQIEDVRYAVSFLKDNAAAYRIDASRIGVMGDSAGGHLAALLGLTCCSDPSYCVQAVVDMFGPTDLTTALETDSLIFVEHVFGVSDRQCDSIKAASPVNYISCGAPPFLIIQGDRDDVVPPDQSTNFYQQLIAAGVPATLIMVKNSGHEFEPVGGSLDPSRKDITLSIADFFDRCLK